MVKKAGCLKIEAVLKLCSLWLGKGVCGRNIYDKYRLEKHSKKKEVTILISNKQGWFLINQNDKIRMLTNTVSLQTRRKRDTHSQKTVITLKSFWHLNTPVLLRGDFCRMTSLAPNPIWRCICWYIYSIGPSICFLSRMSKNTDICFIYLLFNTMLDREDA